MGALESLTLTGAYRLTDGCVAAICGARGAALRSLKISGNQQLTAAFVASIASECDSLERLALEERTRTPGPPGLKPQDRQDPPQDPPGPPGPTCTCP